MMLPVEKGMGSYFEVGPEDAYYDPDRPEWLPRWWLTSSEFFSKWGFYPGVTTLDPKTLPPPPQYSGPPVPPAGYQGVVTDPEAADKLVVSSWAKQLQETEGFFKQLAGEEAERKKQRDEDTFFGKYGWWLAAGAGVLLIGSGIASLRAS